METKIWPAEQKIQHATMMLYHNIKIVMITERSGNFLHFKIHFIRKWKKLRKIYKFILAMSPQPVNQNGGEGGRGERRESNRQNKKENDRRCVEKNKMLHTE